MSWVVSMSVVGLDMLLFVHTGCKWQLVLCQQPCLVQAAPGIGLPMSTCILQGCRPSRQLQQAWQQEPLFSMVLVCLGLGYRQSTIDLVPMVLG